MDRVGGPPPKGPLPRQYVQLASMARGALLQMTNPKLRVFRHAVPLAALILVVNISVTVGVVYYYIYHACQTQSAVMLNFVGEEGLTILKENPGVEIISSYAMGISATEYSYLTSSSSNVTWASIFTPCPDGDNTCGSSQITAALYQDCYTFSEGLAAAVGYTTYIDVLATLIVVLVYGIVTGQLRRKLSRQQLTDIMQDELNEITLGDAVMELRQENKDLREELQKQTKELKDDLHKQNKEMRAEIVKLLATLGKTEISVSQRKNML